MAFTQQERDEVNARMLELYGFSLDECEELSYKLRKIKVWHNSTPLSKLNRVAYTTHSKRKSKGANKGYKYTYERVWSGRMTRREYLDRYEEIDPRECGLFLCKVERDDFTSDRYWDVPSYREEAIKSYRERIKAIRMRYGLSKSEVSEFMRVA